MNHKENEKEILEELADLSPLLGQVKKQGQQVLDQQDVPPQYFEQLPEILWQKIQSEQALDLTSAVPTAARKSWMDELLEQLQRLFSPRLAIGFSLVLMLMVAWFAFLQLQFNTPGLVEQNSIPGIQDVPEDELYRYVLTNIEDYATEDFLEVAGSMPFEFAWPTIENEESLEEVIDELLEEMGDADWSDFM
jgi:hypothetical protein